MTEEKIIIGEGTEFPLNGILTLPENLEKPIPAVVFVHGSGSSNMDEKVMKLTPFKDLAEGLGHGFLHGINGDGRGELLQVHHPAADGVNTLGLQLCLGGVQITAQLVHIHINEQSAVMIGLLAVFIEGVARKFPARRQNVIPAGHLRRDPQGFRRQADDLHLPGHIVILLGQQECKIQIPQIMEDCPAAGQPPGQMATLLLQEGGSAFFPGILIAPNDHRILVLPQVEDAGFCLHCVQKHFFHR